MGRVLTDHLSELGISPCDLSLRGLVPFEEATWLVVIQVDPDGREHRLVPAAAQAWRAMKNAALSEGIELTIVSAFRSVERQLEIIRRKLRIGMDLADVLAVSAPPGYSEHHTGKAVDLAVSGEPALQTEFEETTAFLWLTANANAFGFYMSYPRQNRFGYVYEPWHWCYKPPDTALGTGASHFST